MNNDDFVTSYIAFAQADEESAAYRQHFWAFERFCELCLRQPLEAWTAILEVLSTNPNPKVVRLLAAGPLEELLVNHGETMIDQIEHAAREDKKVAELLGGVWPGGIQPAVWKRIESARSHTW